MFKNLFQTIAQKVKAFEEKPLAKQVIRYASLILTTIIVLYLLYKLTLIGWDRVLDALPATPWFYILLFVGYFILPVFQVFIYQVAWHSHTRHMDLFIALLKKRVFDKDVLGYSGEMYLYLWARKYVRKSEKEIVHVLKDNIILSSTASTLVAATLLLLFLAAGHVSLPEKWASPGLLQISIFSVCLIMLGGIIIKFRKRILFQERGKNIRIFTLHIFRLLIVQGIQLLQWMVVMPEIPIDRWFTLLAVQIIITRIPLLPSRDLIFFGTGIEMAVTISAASSTIAGMLLTATVIGKLTNLMIFVLMSLLQRRTAQADAEPISL